jgi:OFA family oxalate/formate antiporter-like MFS transporter
MSLGLARAAANLFKEFQGEFMSDKSARTLVLIACACAIFWPGAFIFGIPGVMSSHWQQTFSAGRSAIGQTIFFILIGATSFMYLCGRWQEKFGPGKLAVIGSVLGGGSVIWLGRVESMNAVHVWAFLVGASSAFIYVPALTVVQRWYPERRGLVSGFFNMAFALSAAVMSPVFTVLLSSWGYRTINLVLGCVALVVGLSASIFIRFPGVEAGSPAAATIDELSSRSVVEALKTREFWCIWLTWVLAGGAGASMLVLATGYGLARGLNLSQAVVLLTAFNLTNGSGRLVSGFFSDHWGRSRTMAISFTGAALAYIFMPHLEGIWLWSALAAVIGFAFGTLFAVSAPLAGDCFGMAHFGAIFGLIFTAYGFLSGPLGPWLSGYILDITRGNYTIVFSYLGIMYLVSAGLIVLVRPWRECRL